MNQLRPSPSRKTATLTACTRTCTCAARIFIYRLVYPDGTSKVLLSVPRWDFNWQLTYVFKEEVAAPKGSRLEFVAHYDNSPQNKFNPDPTKLVKWGDADLGRDDDRLSRLHARQTGPADGRSRRMLPGSRASSSN